MFKSIGLKLLVLLSALSLIALSSALLLRELMIKDFKEFLEGESEGRVYLVMASLEGNYERYGGWKDETISKDIIWALMLGLETRLRNTDGNVVIDTERALGRLTPLMKKRILAISGLERAEKGEFTSYPLFLEGKEIGTLDVRFLRSGREEVFIQRSDRFLFSSLLTIGALTIILGIFFSRRLTDPIKKLSEAAKAISNGNLKSRVDIKGSDELARLSATFNGMAKTLEMQESLRKKLLSNIAHEFRTPVSAIRGEIEGMLDGIIPLNKESLQSLNEEIGRLKSLIEGMEELVRAQASALSLRKEPINLRQFLGNIMDRFARVFIDKGIVSEIHCNEDLRLIADPERLSQVIINLLDNALKATGQGGRIWIKAGVKGHDVFIEVSDTGCGIKEKDLPFIFERFFSISEDNSRRGLGLGLAIVKELIEAHEGRIEVKSKYGKGSTFIVYIPSDLHNPS